MTSELTKNGQKFWPKASAITRIRPGESEAAALARVMTVVDGALAEAARQLGI